MPARHIMGRRCVGRKTQPHPRIRRVRFLQSAATFVGLKRAGTYAIQVRSFETEGRVQSRNGNFATVLLVPAMLLALASPMPAKNESPPAPALGATQGGRGDKILGELKKWHKVTLAFEGPNTAETADPNPFTDYRLNVTFKSGDTTYLVPGYYAADGNAAETSADAGNVWLVHFCPDKTGTWTYAVSFRKGPDVAVNADPQAGASAGFCDGASGSFAVGPTDKTGRDHRAKGRLQYVGKHHLRFAETGEYFVKGGADAPENFLAYDGFDNTPDNGKRRKSWGPHVKDWRSGDPQWQNGKGKGILGAIHYLAAKGMNAFSFLTMNIGGDDKNVFPYIDDRSTPRTRFDCSKLAQWEIVFEHADRLGLYLHFKTQETENDQLLDGGELGLERKLYYRELIARFGHHLALNWNLGEENTNTDAQRKAFAQYFYDHDPYRSNVVLHTYPGKQESVYRPLLGTASKYTGASIQIGWDKVHAQTKKWVDESAAAGRPWVVANDEQNPANDGAVTDAEDFGHDGIRKETLWGNLLAGGAGVEYYFGYEHPESDLSCQDWRSRDYLWDLTRYALEFFRKYLPFWEMKSDDERISARGAFCLSKPGEVYAVYLKNGGTTDLDLSDAVGTFEVKWYDPRSGSDLKDGSVKTVEGGGRRALGTAPAEPGKDWAVLVRKVGAAGK